MNNLQIIGGFLIILIIWCIIVFVLTKVLNSSHSKFNMIIIISAFIFIVITGSIIIFIMIQVFKAKESIIFPKFSDDNKGIVIK